GALPALWYHIAYETYDAPPPTGTLRFHAQWRQERPTVAVGPRPNVQLHGGVNLDGAENYVALDAVGAGQMVGLLLEINNVAGGWYGEGDGMVFVDGDCGAAAVHPRDRHRGGLRRRRVSRARVRRSVSRVPSHRVARPCRAGRRVPLVRPGPDPVHALAALDVGARPRQQLRERVRIGGLLV